MKLYLQMWSLRDQSKEDFKKALASVADMGYDGVEFAGYFDVPAQELKAYMDELGLETLSAHVPYELLKDDLDNQIEILKTLGARYIACPWTDMDSEEKAKTYGASLTEIGKKTAAEGLLLLYHNHNHEFTLSGDVMPIDIFFETVEPDFVQQQPDVFWVAHAGMDVGTYLKNNAKRIPVVHLKQISDMEEKKNVPANEGVIDFKAVMEMLPEAYFIYEQEETEGDIAEDVRVSLNYIKGLK